MPSALLASVSFSVFMVVTSLVLYLGRSLLEGRPPAPDAPPAWREAPPDPARTPEEVEASWR